MNKIKIALVFSLICIGCSTGKYPTETEDAMKYRQVAWNSLAINSIPHGIVVSHIHWPRYRL